jgi:hypothetical protein
MSISLGLLLFAAGLVLGYCAGAIRIARKLIPRDLTCAIFEPGCDETSVQTLKRASEALQSQAATMTGAK